jgi:hypothetical protein
LTRHRSAALTAGLVALVALLGPGAVSGAGTAAVAATGTSQAGLLFPRLLNWSGITWRVYAEDQKGPENVPLTNSNDAVHVDAKGRLHLRIMKVNGVWRSVELESVNPVDYGLFRMQVDTKTAQFDKWTVLGMFIFHPGGSARSNEIDIEDSRFPNLLRAPNNAQFTVQPYYKANHEHGYQIKKNDQPLVQQFTWHPGANGKGFARFQTRHGTTSHSRLVARWAFHGGSVPVDRNMHLYLNLWTNHGKPPLHGGHSATIDSFTYRPS